MRKSVFSQLDHSSTIVARARAVRMSPGATPEAQGARHSGRTEGTRRGRFARRNHRGGKGVKVCMWAARPQNHPTTHSTCESAHSSLKSMPLERSVPRINHHPLLYSIDVIARGHHENAHETCTTSQLHARPPFHSLHRSCPLPLTKAFAKLSSDTKLVRLPSGRPLLENLKVAISCSVAILEPLRQG